MIHSVRFKCVLDTNLIYPLWTRDLLLWFAFYDLYTPKWSSNIFSEWINVMERRRYLPDIDSKNAIVRGYAERNAINAPIQGSAADIIKLAMIKVFNRMEAEKLNARMLLQVHDELVFDVPKNEVDAMRKLVKEEMESAVDLIVPMVVEMEFAENWLEAH